MSCPALELGPCTNTDLQELAQRQQRQTAAHWFRTSKDGHAYFGWSWRWRYYYGPHPYSFSKNWFLLSTPCQRHKKEGELTGLIYGPLVNDDTPSTPFHTVPVHDTSISINSHHPSEGAHSPLGSPTWLQVRFNSRFSFCSSPTILFCCAVVVLLLI